MPGATVINIESGEPYDEYIGHQMPPFMSPRGEYLPRRKALWQVRLRNWRVARSAVPVVVR
jgi:hypothetical protein